MLSGRITTADNLDKPDSELLNTIDKKLEEYKAEKKKKKERVPFTKMVFNFADGTDKCLFITGYITAIATGIVIPGTLFIFGNILNSFGDDEPVSSVEAIN